MIADKLSNLKKYENVHPTFKTAVKFLEKFDKEKYAVGKHEIDGTNVYAVVSEYTPKNKEVPMFEAHNKYIDIQVMIEGSELQWYTNRDEAEEAVAYNEEKDAAFYAFDGTETKIDLKEKMFAIYFPEDAHLPNYENGKNEKCLKVIVKCREEIWCNSDGLVHYD